MLAEFVGGRLHGRVMPVEAIEQDRDIWNGKFSRNWSAERARGGCVPRAELDNLPLVDGYLSPMWDGGKIRYETQEVYDMLSR